MLWILLLSRISQFDITVMNMRFCRGFLSASSHNRALHIFFEYTLWIEQLVENQTSIFEDVLRHRLNHNGWNLAKKSQWRDVPARKHLPLFLSDPEAFLPDSS